MCQLQLETKPESKPETTLTFTREQYVVIDHDKRATESDLRLVPGSTFTTYLLTHINSPTSTWPTLEALLLDPAYRHDNLCPASDLIAALEAAFAVFTGAKHELAKVLEGVEGFRTKRTPGQLEMMTKQYERYQKPRIEAAKGKDESTLSKAELRKWIMGFMSARDGMLEDLARWKMAYGSD